MQPEEIREQRIGDQQIDTGNFNRIVQAVKSWLSTKFDPAQFETVDKGIGGREIRLRRDILSAGLTFTGTVDIGVVSTGHDSDTSKPWVKIDLDTNAVSQDLGPPPNPRPSNELWFRKAGTAGDIVVPRA